MIRFAIEDALAIVTISNPRKRNALSPEAMVAFRDALWRAEDDASVRAIIITGEGTDAFCAGADLHNTLPSERPFIADYFDRRSEADHPLYIRNIAFSRLALRKPTIAAVNGAAVGGGMEIALNCDLCIASERARFGLTEVRVGSAPAIGGIQRIVRSLPRPLAMRLILTGEIVDAAFALRWGLISEVTPADQLLSAAKTLGAMIAANAPLAVKAAKMLAEKAAELSFAEAAQLEELIWGHLYATADRIEGRRAFAEKRPPRFAGK